MLNLIKEAFLNTPKKYWFVVFGYHLHKSFFGVVLLIISITLLLFNFLKYRNKKLLLYLGLISWIIGTILIVLSILGNVYTNHLPYFNLLEPYP